MAHLLTDGGKLGNRVAKGVRPVGANGFDGQSALGQAGLTWPKVLARRGVAAIIRKVINSCHCRKTFRGAGWQA